MTRRKSGKVTKDKKETVSNKVYVYLQTMINTCKDSNTSVLNCKRSYAKTVPTMYTL